MKNFKVNSEELVALAGIFKAAQAKRKTYGEEAYPNYTRSLMHQSAPDPKSLGIRRGVSTGTLGAILAALATRLMTDDPKLVGAGAGVGALAGGIPGYLSGKREANSERSRLRFLKRLGITRPGELESVLRIPNTTGRVTEPGVII